MARIFSCQLYVLAQKLEYLTLYIQCKDHERKGYVLTLFYNTLLFMLDKSYFKTRAIIEVLLNYKIIDTNYLKIHVTWKC